MILSCMRALFIATLLAFSLYNLPAHAQAAFGVFGRIDDKTQILFEDNWL